MRRPHPHAYAATCTKVDAHITIGTRVRYEDLPGQCPDLEKPSQPATQPALFTTPRATKVATTVQVGDRTP